MYIVGCKKQGNTVGLNWFSEDPFIFQSSGRPSEEPLGDGICPLFIIVS